MVLEFLRAFGEAFDLKDEFPDGVSLGEEGSGFLQILNSDGSRCVFEVLQETLPSSGWMLSCRKQN